MICISESDIYRSVTHEEVVEAVEQAMRLYETDGFHMPDRMHTEYRGNTLLLMPCFAADMFGTKLVSVFPGNAGKQVPVVIGTMTLNDGKTGEPMAILNGTVLTAMRTGAVGAVGVRHTTPSSLKTLGIVGAGIQGYHQALFSSYVRTLSEVYVYDTDKKKAAAMVDKISLMRPRVRFRVVPSIEMLLEKSEAVITATTAKVPVLPDDESLLKGKTFIGVGSFQPEVREFPKVLFRLVDRVMVDTNHAVNESGDLVTPLKEGWINRDRIITMGRFISEGEQPKEGETLLFKSVGMALFDLVVSNLIYQNAKEKGLGTEIQL